MKRVFLICFLALTFCLPSCSVKVTDFSGPKEGIEKIFVLAENLHDDIEVIVTDPEMRVLIPDDLMMKLTKVDAKYQKAKSIYEGKSDLSGDPKVLLLDCANLVINALDTTGVIESEKVKAYITVVRISAKLLKNRLK